MENVLLSSKIVNVVSASKDTKTLKFKIYTDTLLTVNIKKK